MLLVGAFILAIAVGQMAIAACDGPVSHSLYAIDPGCCNIYKNKGPITVK